MRQEHILLLSFGYFDQGILDTVSEAVKTEFRTNVAVRDGHLDISEFYDAARRQYNANTILRKIESGYASDNVKTIGLFGVDLFIPILTYIFGQAYLNGNTGIASAYRLTNERYGLTPDETAFMERIAKEVIHELGHMYGLVHCTDPLCVMRSSTYVEDIDQKGRSFCPSCRNKAAL
jgi:archaemetzincin